MNAKLVMSSLKNNIVPTSWNSCFKAKEPMEWIKQLGKRIRYFKKWATSGTPHSTRFARYLCNRWNGTATLNDGNGYRYSMNKIRFVKQVEKNLNIF